MFRLCILATLGFAVSVVAPASAACAGADPAIAGATVKNVTQTHGSSRYTVAVTVTNEGSMAQAKDVLQFVDIYQVPGEKLDAKGVPPLQPGGSYTFTYDYLRSNEAGMGTTTLRFQLDMRNPSPPGAQDCNAANDTFTLRL